MFFAYLVGTGLGIAIVLPALVFFMALLNTWWIVKNRVTQEELREIKLQEMIGKPVSLCELRRRKAQVPRQT